LEVLNHYKRKIEKNQEDEEILLRSLAKLDGVRVNIALLQDTGIGRTVSLLKKQYNDHDIGTKSRDLVTKWKDVVAREERVSEESEDDKEEGASPTGDEEAETTGSENHNLDDHYENEKHTGTNGHVETEVTQRNGNEEESDKEQHKKSKKHKKDKEREKDRKDKHRNDDDKEKAKKKKSSHRDHSEEESEPIKTEIKSEYIKQETISHSSIKKERIDKDDRTDKEEKKEKHSHEDKKDKYGSREDKRDKKDKHTKEKENKEKSREHKSSNGEHRSKHEKSNGELSKHEKSNGELSKPEKSNGEHSKSSSSKHSESRDKEKEKERKIKSEKEVPEGKSHKDKHRDKDRTKDDSDRKHSSSKSKDKPKSEMEESHDRSEKQRLKDKKKKSESASMGGFDMFANMGGGGDKKHKKRPREDSTEEIADKTEDAYKPTTKQPKVDKGLATENGFSAAMDHKKFKLPTPPRIDSLPLSGPSFIPDISPHYKPLPRVPPPPASKVADDGVTLDALIASRGKRQMAVYSGAKRGGYRGDVPTLKDQCIQKLKDNVDDIYECGGLSFDVLEPILIRASSETLMQIEQFNPYLMEDTGNIWEGFCKKEFRNKQRNAEDLESWREMYERCLRERDEKLQQLKNKVSKNFNSRGEAKDSAARQTKMAFVDQVSKPPREVRAQQAKNGTALPVGHSFKPGAGNSKVGMRNSDPTSGGRRESVTTSKKPKTAPMMAKVRRMMRR